MKIYTVIATTAMLALSFATHSTAEARKRKDYRRHVVNKRELSSSVNASNQNYSNSGNLDYTIPEITAPQQQQQQPNTTQVPDASQAPQTQAPQQANTPAPQQTNTPAPSTNGAGASSNPASCEATNKPSARCENAFHTTITTMMIGGCRLTNYGYTEANFVFGRDQGCLRLRCLEGELAYFGQQEFGTGCSKSIQTWFSTITNFDYSANQCVTSPNTFNSMNHCKRVDGSNW